MIGYVINYKDEAKRRSMESGLLVTHPLTNQMIAMGVSPLSDLLTHWFSKGLEVSVENRFMEKKTLKAKPFDVASFDIAAPHWFERAHFHFARIDIQPPLATFVPVAMDLSASYHVVPFELIKIAPITGKK